jgi:uncharacterized protein YebE (UPF0316 family)
MLKLCIGIFLARLIDVSLGTIRTILSVKGKTIIATIIAFFEVLIWFLVAREALNTDIDSLWIPLSYSLGFATGTLIGIVISKHFIDGLMCVQVITKKNNDVLINTIRQNGYGLSIVSLNNDYDEIRKEMLIIELNKKSLKKLVSIIKKTEPNAFLMINETKVVQNGFIK